ncbi:MAG TPA: acyl-CoA reductase [Flavobacterium sp.]|nr:acyl-CoA reductase [Flavobacterium sp.]
MLAETKINAFIALGNFLRQFQNADFEQNNAEFNAVFFDDFARILNESKYHNGWFTLEQVTHACKSWADALQEKNIRQWISAYDLSQEPMKKVGLILAGNIPMVGFHDVLSVLMSGNIAHIKLSSNDQKIIPFLLEYLKKIEPEFVARIEIVKERFDGFDAVIATGSNNTSRYFEYYFGKYPNIIRQNRNSVAVLNGNETSEQLELLGEDIFRYYGLGCRNVSKLLVPKDYDFKAFFEAIYLYKDLINYEKYANNYDYNKAVFLMSEYQILDNGFLTLRESEAMVSPISTIFYERYADEKEIFAILEAQKNQIQCVVSSGWIENSIPFGTTQSPQLWDYADGVDTMNFLTNL